jgi:DNA-binding transcriptional MocR family regulator
MVQGEPRPGVVELGPGYLDEALVPAVLIRRWAAAALDYWGARPLAYGANAGPLHLRAYLAARVNGAGYGCGPENVMTTGGTSQALDQLAVRLAGEGRAVLTEALTYDLGRMIFTGRGVPTVAVPGPVNDLDIGEFRRAAARAARATGRAPAFYLIPTFHNPTGRVISAGRRREILALADETGSLVIEDQAYADLCYESAPPPPPLWHDAADPDRVISLYSLAKCLAPGLRIGWLVTGPSLVTELAAQPVRLSGGGPNHFAATIVAAGAETGELEAHIGTVRDQLRLRRNILLSVLAERLPAGFTVNRPSGGFFAWVALPGGVDDEDLLASAERRGVSFAAGRRFGASARGVRLCFASCGPERLSEGAARFAAACRLAAAAG